MHGAAVLASVLSAFLWLPCFDVSPTPQGPRHPWTSFKVGSWVKLAYKTRMGAGVGAVGNTSYTMTLLEIGKEKVKLEYETGVAGATTKSVIEQPVNQDWAKTYTKGATGTETLKIAGKSYRCTWTEWQIDQDNTKGTMKVWNCPAVPGHMVKMEGKYSAGGTEIEYSGEVEDFKVK